MPQSAYGAVGDDEQLVRVLTDKHYKGSKVQTTAFNIKDIMSDGISMVRLGMTNVVEFQAVAEDIRRKSGAHAVQGALALRADLLRGLEWPGGSRKLCLFDDPVFNEHDTRDNPAHCMAVSPIVIEKVDAQEIRDNLMTIFSEARYLNDLWPAADDGQA